MLTLTSEYALRAMIYLAQHVDKQPITGRQIAEQAGIPVKYLSRVLGDLVRAGVLESTRGKSGGFRLERPPKKIRLLDVVTPFEPFGSGRCPFGNQRCSDERPCRAHERWKKVVESERKFLENTSLQDIAVEAPARRRRRSSLKRR